MMAKIASKSAGRKWRKRKRGVSSTKSLVALCISTVIDPKSPVTSHRSRVPHPSRFCLGGSFQLETALVYFLPQLFPRIFRIQLGQLTQDLLRLLVAQRRNHHLHLDDLVAAHAFL